VTASELLANDLIVVDWDLEAWPDRVRSDLLAVWPDDGLALAGVLRSHMRRLDKPRPTAFALQSSYLNKLSGDMPREYRAHALARLLNLEWVFEKPVGKGVALYLRQLSSLARAVAALPDEWPDVDSDEVAGTVKRLLGIPARRWRDQAWRDIERCRPPIHDLGGPSRGVAFLRWLLQRVLPFPGFLWDEHQLAVRLGVQSAHLATLLEGKPAASLGLESCVYRGILSDFYGRRWWRTGVEATLWRITGGDSGNREQIATMVSKAGIKASPLGPEQHVVCLNERLEVLGTLVPAGDAVRILPDDWPVFAEPAWARISLARDHPHIRAIVVADDLVRLEA
jgi:hypothetical protein